MKSCFVTFRSVTFAQRAEAMLRQAGIACVLQRTPKWMEARGCGYCLSLREQQAAAALEVLDRNQIGYRKVYLRREDGSVEERKP